MIQLSKKKNWEVIGTLRESIPLALLDESPSICRGGKPSGTGGMDKGGMPVGARW